MIFQKSGYVLDTGPTTGRDISTGSQGQQRPAPTDPFHMVAVGAKKTEMKKTSVASSGVRHMDLFYGDVAKRQQTLWIIICCCCAIRGKHMERAHRCARSGVFHTPSLGVSYKFSVPTTC